MRGRWNDVLLHHPRGQLPLDFTDHGWVGFGSGLSRDAAARYWMERLVGGTLAALKMWSRLEASRRLDEIWCMMCDMALCAHGTLLMHLDTGGLLWPWISIPGATLSLGMFDTPFHYAKIKYFCALASRSSTLMKCDERIGLANSPQFSCVINPWCLSIIGVSWGIYCTFDL